MFVITRIVNLYLGSFFYVALYFTITGVKNIVRLTEDFVIEVPL